MQPDARQIEPYTKREREHAELMFGPFRSTHEGYGVLCEEVDELLQAIRANDAVSVFTEAVQVAAVSQRIAECVTLESSKKRSGME